MSKRLKLTKAKDQRDLTELWQSNMQKDQELNDTPSPQKPQSVKKRTPPSTEKPTCKRSVKSQEAAKEKEMQAESTKSNDTMDIEDTNLQNQIPAPEPKVQLTPELLELHRMLNKDWSEKLDQKLDPLQSSVNDIKANLTTQEVKIEQVMKIKDENLKLHNRCNQMEKENKQLKDRLTVIENHLLENNIILQGVTEDNWELNSIPKEKTIYALADTIEANTKQQQIDTMRGMPIKKVQRLGKYNSTRGRPISVSFTYKEDANYVYENKSSLKKGIYLDREYNDETENNRRILRPILKAARSKEEYRKKCKMEANNLIIKGVTYTVNNLANLPEEINGYNSTSKQDNNSIGFFGELNPMSNFHRCNFEVEGITYHSAEQFIQREKAVYFKDNIVSTKIQEATTPMECKQLAREIKNVDHDQWKKVAKEISYPGIEAKFTQNKNLCNILKNT